MSAPDGGSGNRKYLHGYMTVDPAGQKNLAYAIRYRAPDRTLTDAEANEAHQRIVEEVKRRVGGTLRA